MTIAEIIELESARKEAEQWNVIHLIKENGEWYRAHDWSAWLMSVFPFGEALNKPLHITAKRMKDGYIDAWVGFPATSIGKYVPNDGSVDFNPISDTQIDVRIEIPAEIGEVSYENLNKMKEEWKASLQINEGKKQRREDREVSEVEPKIIRITDIMSRVLSFPLESKSPIEALGFLSATLQASCSQTSISTCSTSL